MRRLNFSDVIVVGLFIVGCVAVFTQATYKEPIPENSIVEAAAPVQQDLPNPSI